MNSHFEKVKKYLVELDYNIVYESTKEKVFVIENDKEGIKNLVIGVTDPILIMELYIFELNTDSNSLLKKLLQKNRDMVHGAFVLDESGTKVIFRDTLQIDNLDLNELEGSLSSLALTLSEFQDTIKHHTKN